MKTLPLSEVKAKLSSMIKQVAEHTEEVTITRNGRPVAVLINPDDYDAWQETLAIVSSPELLAEIRSGLRALRAGAKRYTLEELVPHP